MDAKRAFDIAVSAAVLVLAAVPMALIAVALRLLSGSGVLYRTVRPGKDGVPFVMYKFRTMSEARDPDGRLLPDEDRLTSIGRILRSSSLDELPELINVLRGDMSLVGPRPLLVEYLSRYTGEQARRHEVRPGLTGWAQVNGRNALGWDDRLALDVWYIDNRSMLLDFRILLMTIKSVISREGISAPDHATMPEFRGSDDAR